MSAELQMSASADAHVYPYRAVSKAAIASIICLLLALPGLIPTFAPMLALSLIGMLTAVIALRATTRFPEEYSGKAIAIVGLAANALIFVGGISEHAYIYLTEVPEGYERVHFYELQQEQNLPDAPTDTAMTIDGRDVFLKGYIHPSSGSGLLRQFILVPDLGTCCFGGQPRSSDMIEVTLKGGQTVRAGMLKRKLAGQFTLNQSPQKVTDFDNALFYRLRVDQIK